MSEWSGEIAQSQAKGRINGIWRRRADHIAGITIYNGMFYFLIGKIRIYGLSCFSHCCIKPKCVINKRDIVANGFRYPPSLSVEEYHYLMRIMHGSLNLIFFNRRFVGRNTVRFYRSFIYFLSRCVKPIFWYLNPHLKNVWEYLFDSQYLPVCLL